VVESLKRIMGNDVEVVLTRSVVSQQKTLCSVRPFVATFSGLNFRQKDADRLRLASCQSCCAAGCKFCSSYIERGIQEQGAIDGDIQIENDRHSLI
jgi:hypothetical protein